MPSPGGENKAPRWIPTRAYIEKVIIITSSPSASLGGLGEGRVRVRSTCTARFVTGYFIASNEIITQDLDLAIPQYLTLKR